METFQEHSQYVLELYEKYIAPQLSSRKKCAGVIGAALIATCTYNVLRWLVLPPKPIRHFPYVNPFTYVWSTIRKHDSMWQLNHLYQPLLARGNGFYVRPGTTGWTVFVTNSEAVKKILLKSELFPKVKDSLGKGETLVNRIISKPNIITEVGQGWKKHRMAATPAFQRAMPVNIFGKLAQRLFEVIDKTDGRVDVPDMMGRYAFDAVTMAGFDFNADAIGDPDSEWVRLYNAMTSGAFHPFYFLFPIFDTTLRWMFPSRVKVHQGVGHFFAKVEEIIAEKRENLRKGRVSSLDNNEKDLCTLLLEAEMDGSGEGLTNAEIKNDLVTYILAGHDTTASALSSAIYLLAAHSDVQAKAREEVLSYLGSEPVDINPTVAQSKEMPYLNMVIKESLRLLSPAISTSPRYATEDCELGGHFIPKGTVVSVHITALQHDGQRWEDPEKFIPERFDISKTKIANSYMPFGNGQRQCIGMNMSLAEQRVLLSMLLKKYEWRLPDDSIHRNGVVMKGVTLIAPKNLQVVFKKRY